MTHPRFTAHGKQVLRDGSHFADVTSPEHAADVAIAMQRQVDARARGGVRETEARG